MATEPASPTVNYDAVTAFMLPRAWLDELKARARAERVSASVIIRRALRAELDGGQP